MPSTPTDAPDPGRSTVARRTVLGAMAAGAAAPGLLALSSPASASPTEPASSSSSVTSSSVRRPSALPGGGDLGPNVIVFSPSTPGIQAKLDQVFRQQESAQFGTGRYAFLFKPGTYSGLNAQLGFYTSIAGLGLSPDDTTINGDVTVDAGWFNGNATQNFWRSAENLALSPVSGTNRWAVAQAAPFRRMHVKGGLNLAPDGYGWASGGYIADSRIDGSVGPYSQQQWYTRDSFVGGWVNAVWNMVFSGVQGAPAHSFPNPPYTTLDTTPVSREKPFLYLSGSEYRVFLPEKRVNARGTTWGNGTPRGTSLPLGQFYVAKPGVTAATLNAALAQGLHLLLTPGIYRLDQPIQVNRAGTVILGLGYATLIPDNGVTVLRTADVGGIRLAGFLIDAGPVNSTTLIPRLRARMCIRVWPRRSAGGATVFRQQPLPLLAMPQMRAPPRMTRAVRYAIRGPLRMRCHLRDGAKASVGVEQVRGGRLAQPQDGQGRMLQFHGPGAVEASGCDLGASVLACPGVSVPHPAAGRTGPFVRAEHAASDVVGPLEICLHDGQVQRVTVGAALRPEAGRDAAEVDETRLVRRLAPHALGAGALSVGEVLAVRHLVKEEPNGVDGRGHCARSSGIERMATASSRATASGLHSSPAESMGTDQYDASWWTPISVRVRPGTPRTLSRPSISTPRLLQSATASVHVTGMLAGTSA
ncbi:hypothetical protein [Streptomyces sp. NPDC005281]|uniref:hypothetical protein n=1 Tax=Streptomyces sp. NPDC005281 TaxID=3155712 RepID=UPI0033A6D67A